MYLVALSRQYHIPIDYAVICTGDFNIPDDLDGYQNLVQWNF